MGIMKPVIKTFSIKLQWAGFLDQDWVEIVNCSLPIQVYNTLGIPMIYTGYAHITPDAFVTRMLYGTETLPKKHWRDVPPTWSLNYNLYEPVSKESFLQVVNDWAVKYDITTTVDIAYQGWVESFDGSMDHLEENDDYWAFMSVYDKGILKKIL